MQWFWASGAVRIPATLAQIQLFMTLFAASKQSVKLRSAFRVAAHRTLILNVAVVRRTHRFCYSTLTCLLPLFYIHLNVICSLRLILAVKNVLLRLLNLDFPSLYISDVWMFSWQHRSTSMLWSQRSVLCMSSLCCCLYNVWSSRYKSACLWLIGSGFACCSPALTQRLSENCRRCCDVSSRLRWRHRDHDDVTERRAPADAAL